MSRVLVEKPFYTHNGIRSIAENYGVWENLVQNAEFFSSIVDVLKIAYATNWKCFSEMCKAYCCDPNLMYCHYSHEFVKEDENDIRAQLDITNHVVRQMMDENVEEENVFFWMKFKDKYGSEMMDKYYVTE